MFKKYPFVKQEGVKDCGCACILMILRYYKGNTSIERLMDLTHTSKNGASAYNLISCFNDLGFYSKGVECGINDLKDIIFPCISHVSINGLNHYIVIYEINYSKNYLLIADPGRGIRRISFSEFSSIWTGVIIISYPVRNVPVCKNVNVLDFIFKHVLNYKKSLFILFLISLISIVLKLVSSFYFKFIIEGVNVSKNYVKSVFLIFSFLSLTKVIINFLRSKFLIIINSKLDFSLVLDSFKRIVSLPYCYYHNRSTGEIVSKINDLGVSRDFICKIFVSLFIDFPLIIISIVFLININFSLFLITLLVFIFYLLLSYFYSKIYGFYIDKIKTQKEIVSSYMYETINGFETVKGINIENVVIEKFNNKYISFLNNTFLLNNHINNQSFFKDIINEFCNIFVLFIGALLVYDGKISIGYLITYSSMMVYFFEPIRNIIDMDFNLKDSRESITRVLSLYENYDDKGVIDFKVGDICFNNLNFSFGSNRDILRGVDVSIKRGERVMIYGNSGSGKSTLLKLLMGYYPVKRGMISIGGNDINNYRLSSLRKNVTYVSQNEILFNDTLINNLKLCTNDNDKILTMTKLLEFNEILDNDLGLNMMIEENGFNLSGGQRQRIVLARALLKKQAQIILIDEGLSQVDVSLERKILMNIFNKFKNKTFIIISHRMENLDLYDRFLKMENGVVYEETL